MNEQALQWATVRMEQRPQGKGNLIPAKAFEHESSYLLKLPRNLPAPYRVHQRGTDQYGYALFDGNYYWVPGIGRDDVKVLEYANRLEIYQAGSLLVEYCLPPYGVKNELFTPPGQPKPVHQPQNRRRPTQEEEKRLRALGESISGYLDFALKPKGIERHGFLRKLYALSRKTTPSVFIASIQRARKYGITDMPTIERIVGLNITIGTRTLPSAQISAGVQQRHAYQEGRLTDHPDLSNHQTDSPKAED